MNKDNFRFLKSHYLSRWAVMRYNQKHQDKILLITDQFVLKNLLAGSTLFYNCLGEMYQDIVSSSTCVPTSKCNNLVLINNPSFKYKTIDEIVDYTCSIANNFLLPNGRVILSFEHRFLIYDRVNQPVEEMLHDIVLKFKSYTLNKKLNLLNKSPSGYGDYFFCLDKNA